MPAKADAAEQALETICALIDERRFAEALDPARRAATLLPDSGDAWWNYAVVLKHARRWVDCLAACERTLALFTGNAHGMHWNTGIAATALGNWPRARAAWTACGIELPPGDGPLEMQIGIACVRLSPERNAEVVFCKRLDPCRARIISVPLPDSGRRFGDIVLHDGERRGQRDVDGRTVGVFDELALLEQSPYGTWEVTATCADEPARDSLLAAFDDLDGQIEDWTQNIEVMCIQCSSGTPHEVHDNTSSRAWRPERMFGLALRSEGELVRLRDHGPWDRLKIRDVKRSL